MILGPPGEPLRGDTLRHVLRAIIERDLNPPLPEPPPEAWRERLPKPASNRTDQQRQAAKDKHAASVARFMAMRPDGCETRTELAARVGISKDNMSVRLSRAGVKPVLKTGSFVWYSVDDARRACIIP